jgi:phosphohistidine phosphatase
MARQIWLLRHADAEPHGTRADEARRLTPRGEDQARAAGVALARLAGDFAAVLYSPKVRASETAELAAEGWSEEQRALLTEHAPLAGGFDAGAALDAMSQAAATADEEANVRVLFVGHEPDLSGVIAELTGGVVDLRKGGVAVVRLDGPRNRSGAAGELVAVLRPRELSLIAGVPVGGGR